MPFKTKTQAVDIEKDRTRENRRGVLRRLSALTLITAAGAAGGSRLRQKLDDRLFAERVANDKLEARVEGYKLGRQEQRLIDEKDAQRIAQKSQLAADEATTMSLALAKGDSWSARTLATGESKGPMPQLIGTTPQREKILVGEYVSL